MQCLRCGKNIPEDTVFCIDCQAEMNKCPVAPGTPVAIPPRPKQNKPRPRTASKDEQISRLRMRTKRMAIAIGTLALLLVVSLTILFLSLGRRKSCPPAGISKPRPAPANPLHPASNVSRETTPQDETEMFHVKHTQRRNLWEKSSQW